MKPFPLITVCYSTVGYDLRSTQLSLSMLVFTQRQPTVSWVCTEVWKIDVTCDPFVSLHGSCDYHCHTHWQNDNTPSCDLITSPSLCSSSLGTSCRRGPTSPGKSWLRTEGTGAVQWSWPSPSPTWRISLRTGRRTATAWSSRRTPSETRPSWYVGWGVCPMANTGSRSTNTYGGIASKYIRVGLMTDLTSDWYWHRDPPFPGQQSVHCLTHTQTYSYTVCPIT